MAKLLLADDEECYRSVLPRFFSRDGHEMKTASNGHQAIEAGVGFRPDVLIIDWLLGDRSGLDVAEELQLTLPELRIIFITGFSREDLLSKAEEREIAHVRCLEKPFEIEDVLEQVQNALAEIGENHSQDR